MVVGYKPDHSDHNQAFTSLLHTAQKCNANLNFDMLQYKQNEVNFFGETYTTSGQKPARNKLSAITAMPSPTNKKQVQSLIAMINYLSIFLPRLSELAELIRELSKDKVPFTCGPEHQAAFQQMKEVNFLYSCVGILQPQEVNCVTDRYKYKRYVAIEIELLAVAWAMEKFHHFLCASHFILETDQKPVEAILSKSLNQVIPGLQQILIRTFAYHFTVRYIPHLTNHLADCFSWPGDQKDTIKLTKFHIHQITNQLHARSDSLQDIRLATQEDDELALLKHTIVTGWPSTIREVPSEIQPYWTFREDLTMEDCIVLKRHMYCYSPQEASSCT